jgi:opine dehydrogenase
MKIAVLGGGHGCYAAAADLTEQGHEVRLWRRDAAGLTPLAAGQPLTVIDAKGRRDVHVAQATADLGRAVRGAELILMPLPAFTQREIAQALAPHLQDGQVVFLPPGTFGSFMMAQAVRKACSQTGSQAAVSWAETGTLPYLARKRAATEVAITIRAQRLPTGVYPARQTDHALSVIAQAYPCIERCEDALSGALMNAGPIIHPPLILMNAGPLQASERYDIHNEGTQPAIRAVTDALDAERIAVRTALGYAAPHFPLRDHYDNDQWMYGDAHQRLVDSGDWREHIDLYTHRYMTEDTLLGLSFLTSVARYAGVAAPIATGLHQLARTILQARASRELSQSPAETSRTLADLGLAALSRTELREVLYQGYP